jgi:hypothetical protein
MIHEWKRTIVSIVARRAIVDVTLLVIEWANERPDPGDTRDENLGRSDGLGNPGTTGII